MNTWYRSWKKSKKTKIAYFCEWAERCKRQILSGKFGQLISDTFWQIKTSALLIPLRENRQQVMTTAVMRKDVKDRIDDLSTFLDGQTEAITKYSDALVRRLIERITVFDEILVVEFKSGLEIQVEA